MAQEPELGADHRGHDRERELPPRLAEDDDERPDSQEREDGESDPIGVETAPAVEESDSRTSAARSV